MKMIVAVVFALVAVAAALPLEEKPAVENLEYTNERNDKGGYSFKVVNNDGSERVEEGQLKETTDEDNKPVQVLVVRGQYSYVNPDGSVETIKYVADEEGYRAEGPSVPKN